jgi:hypothetical protein
LWTVKYSARDEEYLTAKGAPEMQEKPTIRNGLAWSAFQALRGSRQFGFGGASPIPFSEIVAYCAHAGVTCPIQRQRLARFVQALDNAEREAYGRNSS